MTPPRSWLRMWLASVGVIAAGMTAALVWYALRKPDPVPVPPPDPLAETGADPARHSPSPYLNTRPGVRYIGDAACATCHPDVAAKYNRHPMARDVARPGDLPAAERTAAARFDKLGCRFWVEPQGGETVHHVACPADGGGEAAERADPVAFAIGSGARGRSFVVNRDGFLFQSPISWYSRDGVWDVSPGFSRTHVGGLPLEPACLYCHGTRSEPVAGTVNRYIRPVENATGVGCERCHGPGQLHVEQRSPAGGPDLSIVNPARLTPELREAVCLQCHFTTQYRVVRRGRDTYDYRPGLPLEEYWALFTKPDRLADGHRHSNRPEQMAVSRCFQGSGGKLGCVSCHDPHEAPAGKDKVAFYRGRCLRCHQEKGCSLSAAARREREPADSCAACHMPRTGSAKGAHVSETDHRVLRRPEPDRPTVQVVLRPGEPLLVPFRPAVGGVGRELGIALAKVAEETPPIRGTAARAAVEQLDAALRRHPADLPGRRARAKALKLLGRRQEAVADLQAALGLAPADEAVLADLAAAADAVGDRSAAENYWRRAVAVNPWAVAYRTRLAELLSYGRRWEEAARESRAALRIDPANTDARVVLVSCLIETGNRAGATREFDTLLATRPPNEAELRRWFADRTR